MRTIFSIVIAVSGAISCATEAVAKEAVRIAFIVTNGRYELSSRLWPLPSAENDGREMELAAKSLGFSHVVAIHDKSWNEVKQAISSHPFIKDAEFVLFYFSGHGVNVRREKDKNSPLLLFSRFSERDQNDFATTFEVAKAISNVDASIAPIASRSEPIAPIKLRPSLILLDSCQTLVRLDGLSEARDQAILQDLLWSESSATVERLGTHTSNTVVVHGATAGQVAASGVGKIPVSRFTWHVKGAIKKFSDNWPLTLLYATTETLVNDPNYQLPQYGALTVSDFWNLKSRRKAYGPQDFGENPNEAPPYFVSSNSTVKSDGFVRSQNSTGTRVIVTTSGSLSGDEDVGAPVSLGAELDGLFLEARGKFGEQWLQDSSIVVEVTVALRSWDQSWPKTRADIVVAAEAIKAKGVGLEKAIFVARYPDFEMARQFAKPNELKQNWSYLKLRVVKRAN